jgi:hypothetical protein
VFPQASMPWVPQRLTVVMHRSGRDQSAHLVWPPHRWSGSRDRGAAPQDPPPMGWLLHRADTIVVHADPAFGRSCALAASHAMVMVSPRANGQKGSGSSMLPSRARLPAHPPWQGQPWQARGIVLACWNSGVSVMCAPNCSRSLMVKSLWVQYVQGRILPSGATRTVERPHPGPEKPSRPRTAARTGSVVATRRVDSRSCLNPSQNCS